MSNAERGGGRGPQRGSSRGGAARNGQSDSRGRGRGRGRIQERGRGARGGHKAGRGRGNRDGDDIERAMAQSSSGGGVNQLKAALRQTKRLLARNDIEPGKRQEAERRLIAIEQDIEAKQTQNVERDNANVERNNAKRYHKIRFFERQKLVRRIKKLKKNLAAESGEEGETSATELQEARVLLNYVLHYPMSHKYVALFPSSTTTSTDFDLTTLFSAAVAQGQPQSDTSITEPVEDASRKKAVEVRKHIEREMETGTLSKEPEMELEKRANESRLESESAAPSSKRKRLDLASENSTRKRSRSIDDDENDDDNEHVSGASDDGGERDDFFASDSEDEG